MHNCCELIKLLRIAMRLVIVFLFLVGLGIFYEGLQVVGIVKAFDTHYSLFTVAILICFVFLIFLYFFGLKIANFSEDHFHKLDLINKSRLIIVSISYFFMLSELLDTLHRISSLYYAKSIWLQSPPFDINHLEQVDAEVMTSYIDDSTIRLDWGIEFGLVMIVICFVLVVLNKRLAYFLVGK